jgi:hypothetical protein
MLLTVVSSSMSPLFCSSTLTGSCRFRKYLNMSQINWLNWIAKEMVMVMVKVNNWSIFFNSVPGARTSHSSSWCTGPGSASPPQSLPAAPGLPPLPLGDGTPSPPTKAVNEKVHLALIGALADWSVGAQLQHLFKNFISSRDPGIINQWLE